MMTHKRDFMKVIISFALVLILYFFCPISSLRGNVDETKGKTRQESKMVDDGGKLKNGKKGDRPNFEGITGGRLNFRLNFDKKGDRPFFKQDSYFGMGQLTSYQDQKTPKSLFSTYFLTALQIVFPVLVMILGFLWTFRKITTHHHKEISKLSEGMFFPTGLVQVPGYLDKLAGQIGICWEQKVDSKEIENVKTQLKDLKERLLDFLAFEKNPSKINIDEIEKKKVQILNIVQNTFTPNRSISNPDYPLYCERKKIFQFIEDKIPAKTISIINICLLIQKVHFIEELSFKPGGISDAILIVRLSLERMNRNIEKELNSIDFKSNDGNVDLKDFKDKKKTLNEDFFKVLDGISRQKPEFNKQLNGLKVAFLCYKRGYNELLNQYSLIKDKKGINEITTDIHNKIEKGFEYLENNHSEFAQIFQNLNYVTDKFEGITKELNAHKEALKNELKNSRQYTGQLDEKISEYNEKVNQFLKDSDTHVTQLKDSLNTLGSCKDSFKDIYKDFEDQKNDIGREVNGLADQNGIFENKINSFQKKNEELEKTLIAMTKTETKLSNEKEDLGREISELKRLNSELKFFTNSIESSTNDFKTNLHSFEEQNRSFKENSEGLKDQKNQWQSIHNDMKAGIEDLEKEINLLKIETGRIVNRNEESQSVVKNLEKVKGNLEDETKNLNEWTNKIKIKMNESHTFFEDLKDKTLKIGGDVKDIRSVHEKIKGQSREIEGILSLVNDANEKLLQQIQSAENISAKLHEQDVQNKISNEKLQKTTEEIKKQIQNMQDLIHQTHSLKEEVTHVENTTKTLEETALRFNNYEKELLDQVSTDSTEIKLARNLFNNELKLNLTDGTSIAILRKLQGEFIESIEYRNYAINCLKEFRLVEKQHMNQWYWKLLKPIKEGLEANKEAFYRHKGQTIYDGIYNDDSNPLQSNPIGKEHLKTVINEQHWGQIWEPLIRAAQFFESYFQDQYLEVLQLLGMSSKRIINLMTKHLNYSIDHYFPLQLVPSHKVESGELQEALNHFLFYQDILPHLKNNQRLIHAGANHPSNGKDSLIVFVDTLGLKDNGKRIRLPKAVLYSPQAIKNLH